MLPTPVQGMTTQPAHLRGAWVVARVHVRVRVLAAVENEYDGS